MGKIWFVTGCSRGLGLVLVEKILESGASVVATARKPEQLSHVVGKYGPDRVLAIRLDVSKCDEVTQAVDTALTKFGRIDVVVNNAGYADSASIEDMDIQSFRRQMETNFFGVVYVTKAVLPIMRKQGSGHIFQVSSIGGRVGSPGLGSYQSAKWAIGGFSTVLSQEVKPLGINVTVLEPGGIKTDWASSSMGRGPISEPYQQTVGAFNELRLQNIEHWSPPSKVADVVLKISEVSDPPLRLLIGPETIEYAKKASDALVASDEKWREVTLFHV
jgi:NAD(P)-dependent dehydrogenase (short-subunit alcohol dehydrogenase family)